MPPQFWRVGGQGGAHFSYYETKTFSLYHEFFHDLILSRLVCIRQVDQESNRYIFDDFIGVFNSKNWCCNFYVNYYWCFMSAELSYMLPASSMLRWGYQNMSGVTGCAIPTSAIPTPAIVLTRTAQTLMAMSHGTDFTADFFDVTLTHIAVMTRIWLVVEKN